MYEQDPANRKAMKPEEVLNPNGKPTPPSPNSPPKMLNTRERYVPVTSKKSDNEAKAKNIGTQSDSEIVTDEEQTDQETTQAGLSSISSTQISEKPSILIRQDKIEKFIEPVTFLPDEKTMKIDQINHNNNDIILFNALQSVDPTPDDINTSPTVMKTDVPSTDTSELVSLQATNTTGLSGQESSPTTADEEFFGKIPATDYPESSKFAHNHPYSLLFIGIILGLIIMTIILKEVFQRGLTPTLQETLNSIFR